MSEVDASADGRGGNDGGGGDDNGEGGDDVFVG